MTDSNTHRIYYLHTFYGLRNAVAACMTLNWVRNILYFTVCVRFHVNVDGIQLKYIDDESLLFCWCFLCIVLFDGATQMYLCNWVCFALGQFNELEIKNLNQTHVSLSFYSIVPSAQL